MAQKTLDFAFASCANIAQAVNAGDISATEVVETALTRIKKTNPVLNAFTDVTAKRARAKAKHIDEQRAAGQPLGPLAGVPFAVKNLFDVTGIATRAGSKINRDLPPAKQDSPLI